MVKQGAQRKEHIRALMNYSFDVCNAFGDVWVTEDEQACALVLYPEKKKSTLNLIWWEIKLILLSIGLSRVNLFMKYDARVNFFRPNKPFSYLCFMGVNASVKNRGQDASLLEDLIHRSDKEKRPIYLETTWEQKLEWYKKYGFEMFQALDFSYPLYMLRRNPG
jgi:hypothetical protein